ncbi:MAG: CPBP family glutamic-type intramembrane protease [Patescibacteria group bacterium]
MHRQPLIQDILSFIRQPKANSENANITTLSKAKLVMRVTCLAIFLVFVIGLITDNLVKISGYSQEDNNIIIDYLSSTSAWEVILIIVILGPILEELAFRLYLKPYKRSFLIGIYFYLLLLISTLFSYTESLTNAYYLIGSVIFATLIIIGSFIFIKKVWIEKVIEKYFRFLVYLSTITFGLIHITNYENLNQYWWLSLLLVLPQLIVGAVLPYVRVRLGFIWSILTHSLYNAILVIVPLGLLAGPGEVSQLISTTENESELLSKFSLLESSYVIFLSFLAISIFLVITIISIQLISEYNRYRKNNKQIKID